MFVRYGLMLGLCWALLVWAPPTQALDDEKSKPTEDEWDEFKEGEDNDNEARPEPADYTRLEWVRLHLTGQQGKDIQQSIACMEAGFLNHPELVMPLADLVAKRFPEMRQTNLALYALRRMSREMLAAGGGLALVDVLLERQPDLARQSDYAKELIGAIFNRLRGKKGRIDSGALRKDWTNERFRREFTAYAQKQLAQFQQANAEQPAPADAQTTDPANPYTQVNYYGKYPVELFYYIDAVPLTQGSEWDIQISMESVNLLTLLHDTVPRLRVGMVTFGNDLLGKMPITRDIDGAKQVLGGLGYQGQSGGAVANGFVLALDWTRRNTAWSNPSKHVAVVISDQAENGDGLHDTAMELLQAAEFDALHAAGHYALTQDPEPAPPFYRSLAKDMGGVATYARKLDTLCVSIAPLAFTDDPTARQELEMMMKEIFITYMETKKDYRPAIGPGASNSKQHGQPQR